MATYNDALAYLDGLSILARRGFESTQDATRAVLQLVAEQLCVSSSFLALQPLDRNWLEIVAVHCLPGGYNIPTGMTLQLTSHFPLTMDSGKEPKPLIIEDLQAEAWLSTTLHDLKLDQLGCYIGVPVLLSDGHFYGALCAVDLEARQFTVLQTKLLVVLARLLATQVERDVQLAERRWAESELAQALGSLQMVNEQRARMDKMQSDFVAVINHEFRTSLTGIQGFSELMLDETFSFYDIKEYAADINADAKRLCRLIGQLLDLDQIKTGQLTFHFELVNLNEIIREVVQKISPNAPNHLFHLQLDALLPDLWVDHEKMQQVVTNLLGNAIKYSAWGDRIIVGSKKEADVIRISVQDEGVGIPEQSLESVFEPYSYQITSESSHYVKGAGLGLALVRQILQMHGGNCWVESKLEKGSTFYFTLPLLPNER